MKNLATIGCLLIVLSAAAPGQVPNGNFETWESYADPDNNAHVYQKPDHWVGSLPTSPQTLAFSLTKFAESYPAGTGASALTLTDNSSVGVAGVALSFDSFPGNFSFADMRPSFAVSGKPATLSFYYRYSPVGGDSMMVYLRLYKAGVPIGGGAYVSPTAVPVWTGVEIPVEYITADTPDSATILMTTFTGMRHGGSSLSVDNLAFDASVTAVDASAGADLPVRTSLRQNYPNPFNPTTVVSYQLSVVSNVRIAVYDVLGREIGTLMDEVKQPGTYSVTWNAAGRPSGVYFCRMQAGNVQTAVKMVLMK
jgi:hypothetical protein